MFQRTSRWKLILTLSGLIIVIATILYTYYIARELRTVIDLNVKSYAKAQENLGNEEDLERDVDLASLIVINNKNIPVIIVDANDRIVADVNVSDDSDSSDKVEQRLAKMKNSNIPPVVISNNGINQRVYYDYPLAYKLLTYFPIFILLLLGAFVLIGYMVFNASRASEQNRVWVGMARETAHQLGTPISAIIAWLEHLKFSLTNPDDLEIIHELEKDVDRLNLVADRFSKIGSEPNLEVYNLIEVLDDMKVYMEKRAPKRVDFKFPLRNSPPMNAYINAHLFSWVMENLLRNSLDAMDREGVITAEVSQDEHHIIINVSDTGKGIPANKIKTVFDPGYTTKKRGWGLGLSLAKRIIEGYHKGKIYVSKSVINEGTTFTIKLPKYEE